MGDTYPIIDVHKLFREDEMCFVSIKQDLAEAIRTDVLSRYGSFCSFGIHKLHISGALARWSFRRTSFWQVPRLLQTATILNIPEEKVWSSIECFYYRGSHHRKGLVLPREIRSSPNFVEGFALYTGEGTTGFNGAAPSRRFVFSNADLDVIKFYIDWIRANFSSLEFRVIIIPPPGSTPDIPTSTLSLALGISPESISVSRGHYNKRTKFNVVIGNVFPIIIFHRIRAEVKRMVRENQSLMAAYLRGIMAAEGTAYQKGQQKYVRIEMHNEEEINYVSELLKRLEIGHRSYLRSNRDGMWSIHIGRTRDIHRYMEVAGFGSQLKRQERLKKICDKFIVSRAVPLSAQSRLLSE
jgi:hypothetical protein